MGTYTYTASATGCAAGTPATKAHAVSAAGTNTYSYDCNGNLTSRTISGTTYTLSYDAENRLTSVSGGATAFVYDGDGNRVKGTVAGVTTVYLGNIYEWTGSTSTAKKYYYAGRQRLGLRQGSGTLYYIHADHLGSTEVTTCGSSGCGTVGAVISRRSFAPYGATRGGGTGTLPTTFRFTGQRQESGLGGPTGDGLYFYGARWYDPALGRFLSADTIVPQPGNPQALNRYSYSNNNPVRYIDPSGHDGIDALVYLAGIVYGWGTRIWPRLARLFLNPQCSSMRHWQ